VAEISQDLGSNGIVVSSQAQASPSPFSDIGPRLASLFNGKHRRPPGRRSPYEIGSVTGCQDSGHPLKRALNRILKGFFGSSCCNLADLISYRLLFLDQRTLKGRLESEPA
jgi:hypothetical protein